MKIAIITLPFNDNYGGILQGYALREYLRNRGHEVIHIEEKSKQSLVHWSQMRFDFWWFTRRFIGEPVYRAIGKSRVIQYEQAKATRENTRKIRAFVKSNLDVKKVSNFSEIKKHGFDCIVVGSDQIWRPLYYPEIENAFLSFAESWEVKKVTYAPSFGVENWEYNSFQTKKCKQFIKQFDALSVREEEGVTLCKEKFNASVKRLLDPTMLLDKKDYEQLINNNLKSKTNQLTTYILDQSDEKRKIVAELISKQDYTHIDLGLKSKADLGESNDESIEFWLENFMNAEFILTDSFHGCVFAVLFQKPFIAFGNKERGVSRFNTLLKVFGLEDRLVFDSTNINEIVNTTINWREVNSVLSMERYKTLRFFKGIGV